LALGGIFFKIFIGVLTSHPPTLTGGLTIQLKNRFGQIIFSFKLEAQRTLNEF
jgi:hypothetical protein